MGYRKAVVLLALLAFAPECRAVPKLVYGAGMVTCAEWSQWRATNDQPKLLQVQSWIDGFLSAANVFGDDPVSFLSQTTNHIAYYAWIDNYCSHDPLDEVATATVQLKNELEKRSK